MSSEEKSNETSSGWNDLPLRLASAAVLLAITGFAVWADGPAFAAVFAVVFAAMYREWETMVRGPKLTAGSYFLIGLVALVPVGAVAVGGAVAWPIALFAAIFVLLSHRPAIPGRLLGIFFLSAVIIAIAALRGEGSPGFAAIFYLGLTIWMTDTGAFFAGRYFGGAKLNEAISPKKTWAGAIGGLVLGTICGLIFWILQTDSPIWIGIIVTASISIAGQCGDLAESAAKRHFQVKDSGNSIPGHGGFLDRLDSLTFGAILAFTIGFVHGGPHMVASGLLIW